MSYDVKFRRHVLKVRESEKLSFARAAKRFGISKQTIYNWTKRLKEKSKRNKPPEKIDNEALLRDVRDYPDAYQHERALRLGVSQRGICDALKRLGVTYKKNSEPSQSMSRKNSYFLPGN